MTYNVFDGTLNLTQSVLSRSRVMQVMGQLTDGSCGSRVTKRNPMSALRRRMWTHSAHMHVDVQRHVYIRQCKSPYVDTGHCICYDYKLLTVIYWAAVRRSVYLIFSAVS